MRVDAEPEGQGDEGDLEHPRPEPPVPFETPVERRDREGAAEREHEDAHDDPDLEPSLLDRLDGERRALTEAGYPGLVPDPLPDLCRDDVHTRPAPHVACGRFLSVASWEVSGGAGPALRAWRAAPLRRRSGAAGPVPPRSSKRAWAVEAAQPESTV